MNNNYFLAFLVAAATLISSAPYCCSLKILTSHFSEYFPFVLLWNLERIILIVGRGNPQPSSPPPLQVACGAGVFWRQKFVYVRIVVAAIFDFMTEEGGESRNSSPEGLRG